MLLVSEWTASPRNKRPVDKRAPQGTWFVQCAPELAKLLGEEIEDPEKEFNSNRLDTPRGHEEEFTEAEELAKELTCVKKDRAELLHSLAHIKTNLIGSGGGEAQTAQILQLEKELELKKLTLNDLRAKGKKLTKSIADAGTQIHDAAPVSYTHLTLPTKA